MCIYTIETSYIYIYTIHRPAICVTFKLKMGPYMKVNFRLELMGFHILMKVHIQLEVSHVYLHHPQASRVCIHLCHP